MRLILLSLFSLLVFAAEAQPLTAEEATRIAHLLGEKKILGEEGEKYLMRLFSTAPDKHFGGLYMDEEYALMSKEGILWFCYAAFLNELMYRSGANLPNREIQRDQRRLNRMAKKLANDPEAYQQLVNSMSEKEYSSRKRFRGFRIEERIVAEDSLPAGWRVLPLFGANQKLRKGLVHKTRSTIGKTRTRTAKELFEMGLINEVVFREIEGKLADTTITTEDQVFAFGAERTKYYAEYPRLRARQLALLDSLVKHDLLTPANRHAIIESLGDNELRTQFEILEQCNRVILPEPVDTATLIGYYGLLMQKMEKVVPEFKYTNLRVRRDTSHMLFGQHEDIILTFESAGQTYGHRFEYYATPDSTGASEFDQSNRYDFYPAVNVWLADHQSPFRLYQATSRIPQQSLWYTPRSVQSALILLTKEQRSLWDDDDLYFLSRENHDNTFTATKINAAIADFERIGLFTHLSKQQIDSCRNEALLSGWHSWVSLLQLFPDVIHGFGWESEFEHPYARHANAFSRLARGHFEISNASDDYDITGKAQKKVHFSFDFNGKYYSKELSFDDDRQDPEFFDLIRHALTENNVPGAFFYCRSDGELSRYIFLTKDQQEFIQTNYPEILSNE